MAYKSKHTGKTIDDAIDLVRASSNRNLLDNCFFANPVNQRGHTEYSGAVYCIDRWKSNSANMEMAIDAEGLMVTRTGTGTGYFRQDIENPIESEEATVSVDVISLSGVCQFYLAYADGTFSTAQAMTSGMNSCTYQTVGKRISRVQFNVGAGASMKLRSAKLEAGGVSTLANDIAPDYGEELLKCQRYLHAYGSASARPSNALDCVPHMRTTPSQTTVVDADGITRYLNVAEL